MVSELDNLFGPDKPPDQLHAQPEGKPPPQVLYVTQPNQKGIIEEKNERGALWDFDIRQLRVLNSKAKIWKLEEKYGGDYIASPQILSLMAGPTVLLVPPCIDRIYLG